MLNPECSTQNATQNAQPIRSTGKKDGQQRGAVVRRAGIEQEKHHKSQARIRYGDNEISGRPEWTRTIDLFRVNYEVKTLKVCVCRTFPHRTNPKTALLLRILLTNC